MCIIGNKSFFVIVIVILVDVDFFTGFFGADFFDDELVFLPFHQMIFAFLPFGCCMM